ncbi:MAG: bifunctional (p)ppGpp synthetase/guanosine-3',5'-bis(diphosphate) 3'-pyrophosphohydrolase [Eubacteriales bacterium]|nr:bifunctional (p)ppGpp synthetase/guanosine-3',5'-bis(diphosphate) 3'-pyrophosphohydrolase [Eubacteriales bacterium]
MTKKETVQYHDYNQLLDLINSGGYKFDVERIEKAYKYAEIAHADQKRISGVPYILHPVSVAYILVELGMDTDSVIAALLHDVVEDTDRSLDDIRKDFGEDIALLIDGLTKLEKIKYSNREEQQAENMRKMLIAMSNDIRVIIIKLADRTHNMRTIECMREQKQRDIALETMELYAPIAHRLGIKTIKEELEDLSLRYLDPVGYAEIERELENTSHDRGDFIQTIIDEITEFADENVKNMSISGRVKSIHSIYRKTYMQGKTIDQIYDIFAVRVIVDTVLDCYNVLGMIHYMYKPIPNRFKDYISTPKPNMYQSLHTTVISHKGVPFEVQIRTREMHHTAEYGIAAHWKYKVGAGSKTDSLEERLSWIRKMIEMQNESVDSTDIVSTIKTDLNPNEVFVFTPKGDVVNLPYGSTVIDLAYAIHTAIGNSMVGAKVDRRIVPIDYQIKTGEIVEILTQKEAQGPRRDWLKIVKTSEARSKIRSWFKREKREENIVEGKAEFERELKRNDILIPDDEIFDFLSQVNLKLQVQNLDDFYAAIGYGGIQLWKVMPRIRELYQKLYKKNPNTFELPTVPTAKQIRKVGSGVIIEGIDDVLIKFSRCCNPLPGDEIIGFVTRGFGVSVHKRDCTNVPKDLSKAEEPARWVNAYWEDGVKDVFQSTLAIICNDRTGMLADVTNQLSALHIMIRSQDCRNLPEGKAIINATIEINGLEHLQSVLTRLRSISGVIKVTRR